MANYPAILNATFWRSLQTLNVSRVVVAIVLAIYLGIKGAKGFAENEYFLLSVMAALYLLVALGFVAIKVLYTKRFMLQLAAQIALDIVVVSLLYASSGGAKSGLAILYLFPLAGIGILAQLLWAMAFVSAVTIFLLVESTYHALNNEDGTSVSQAGLYGAAYFVIVIVINRLARNLIRQEELAHTRGLELAVQQAINRLVIADMGDGILVVDQDERLFEINPAAGRILGLQLETSLREVIEGEQRPTLRSIPVLLPILEAMHARTRLPAARSWGIEEDTNFVAIRGGESVGKANAGYADIPRFDVVTHLKLRFVDVDHSDIISTGAQRLAYTIVFMQDVSDIENKAQQLKLASMGRLTASIAHEVRNPLTSISYAASLLSEDLSDVEQARRLLKIVDDNVARLNQLIEDILKLSRKAHADTEPFLLAPVVIEIVQDFVETRGLALDLIAIEMQDDFKIVFDVSHLREIIVNLMSNALRYASRQPGSIRLYTVSNAGQRCELHIEDDGPGIAHAVRSHLFEPFYTTSNKGTGLGLYMARELCLNNHALLDYDYRADESGAEGGVGKGSFVINFSLNGPSF